MSRRSPPIYCTLNINRHAGAPEKQQNKSNVVHLSSHMVVIIYCYIGCKDKATIWYLNGFPEVSNLGSTVYVCMYVWSSHIAEYGSTG